MTEADSVHSTPRKTAFKIGEKPWTQAFLQSLAAGLRKMGGELDPADEGGQS